MTKLSVNLNKVALLRNQRDIGIPSVIEAARTVIKAGAHGVTVHPRPDERHIRYADVYELTEMLTVEFNIEGNPFTGKYMEIVRDVKPNQATLVNMQENIQRLAPVVKELKGLGIRVSLFMDPEKGGIKLAKEVGTDRIELYTEPYARAFRENEKPQEMLELYSDCAGFAGEFGLGVNAGHDLNLKNLGKFCSNVPGLLEVSIGHALISDAIEMGLARAVKEYLKILSCH
ncbi:MAG: pyridoxine 5'-phosphate synthase [Planctomycetota bacterium]|jgi:pyridoxine 5-phosphate synthase